MPISYHLAYFNKKKTAPFDTQKGIENPELAYRVFVDYDSEQSFDDVLQVFCNDPKAGEVKQLVIGSWMGEDEFDKDSSEVVELLVENKDKLGSLEALMIGDITYEENEISWIEQSDVNPVIEAFPKLKHLQLRGGNGLSLGKIEHSNLEKIVIQSGGMPSQILHQLAKSSLPNLTHLELWLGSDNYGWNGDISDVQLLYSRDLFPKLAYLGLKNSEIANDIALSLKDAEILNGVKELDLGKGTMTDEGAQGLIDNLGAYSSLKILTLKSNYLSSEMIEKLRAGLTIKKIETKDQKDIDEDPDYRYVDVGE